MPEEQIPKKVADLTDEELLQFNALFEKFNEGIDPNLEGDFWLIAERQAKDEMKRRNLIK